jgi:hypothetical protein
MPLLLLIIGFVLFFLGLGYLFQPQLILRFNAFMRDTFFKDSLALLYNRRVGIYLVLLSFILLALARQAPR